MRVFDHPNLNNFLCPICGTRDDKQVVLIGIAGTEEDKMIEAEQVHFDCLDNLRYFKDNKMIASTTVK
jgi:hypothetical protein